MKPIVCKANETSLDVDVTVVSGETVKIKKKESFSLTAREIHNIQLSQIEALNKAKDGEIVLELDLYLNLLTKVYDKNRDWFLSNMDIKSIKCLYSQVREALEGAEKNE